MAIRDKMRANAQVHLEPGEVIQQVFGTQTVSNYFALISFWIIVLSNAYRVVVVTDKRILVCRSGRLKVTPVNEILHEMPRTTRIGPRVAFGISVSRLATRCISIGDSTRMSLRPTKRSVDPPAASANLYHPTPRTPTAQLR